MQAKQKTIVKRLALYIPLCVLAASIAAGVWYFVLPCPAPDNTTVYDALAELALRYPERTRIEIIGYSTWGQPLYALVCGAPSATQKVMIQGAIHARESATAYVVLAQARYLLRLDAANARHEGASVRALMDDVQFWFIPLLNPDGAQLCAQGLEAAPQDFRQALLQANGESMDFSLWKANGRGVDLNANFDARWDENTSVQEPAPANYGGQQPFSETETQAVLALVREGGFRAMVCYHSTGEVIYWYFGQTGENLARDNALALSIAGATQYRLVSPADSMDSVAGSKDWFVLQYGLPGFTIELFPAGMQRVPRSQIARAFEKNKNVPLLVAA